MVLDASQHCLDYFSHPGIYPSLTRPSLRTISNTKTSNLQSIFRLPAMSEFSVASVPSYKHCRGICFLFFFSLCNFLAVLRDFTPFLLSPPWDLCTFFGWGISLRCAVGTSNYKKKQMILRFHNFAQLPALPTVFSNRTEINICSSIFFFQIFLRQMGKNQKNPMYSFSNHCPKTAQTTGNRWAIYLLIGQASAPHTSS